MAYKRGTQSEAARREGVHRSTISRRVRDGKERLDKVENGIKREERIREMREQLGDA